MRAHAARAFVKKDPMLANERANSTNATAYDDPHAITIRIVNRQGRIFEGLFSRNNGKLAESVHATSQSPP
jgi:hypothetical protein